MMNLTREQGARLVVNGRTTCDQPTSVYYLQKDQAEKRGAIESAIVNLLASQNIQADVRASVSWGDVPGFGPIWLIEIYPKADYTVDENKLGKAIYDTVVSIASKTVSGCSISWFPYDGTITRLTPFPISPVGAYALDAFKWVGVIAAGVIAWYLLGPLAGLGASLGTTLFLRPYPLGNYLPNPSQLGTYAGFALLVGGVLFIALTLMRRPQIVVIKE